MPSIEALTMRQFSPVKGLPAMIPHTKGTGDSPDNGWKKSGSPPVDHQPRSPVVRPRATSNSLTAGISMAAVVNP